MGNIDEKTVASFGDEWSHFDQSGMSASEARKVFNEYFSVFPWQDLPPDAVGFDMGCGSGRWARWVAPRVGCLHCIDPSAAIEVARANLAEHLNTTFHCASVDESGLQAGSQDFGYSLGVLHHVPDTAAAIRSCVRLLKPRAPLLLYLYYAFDNRPWWFRALWRISDWGRQGVYRFPPRIEACSDRRDCCAGILAASPIQFDDGAPRVAGGAVPLSYYRDHSFYTMRTDARDRFGTPLEQRFSQDQIAKMMESAGLVDVRFSDTAPYWCAVGLRAS